jgi:UDP-3-O-[3-hydroxymyristoyl] glucosamine N-acyltransferase
VADIAPGAHVDPGAWLGEAVSVAAGAVVAAGAEIGAGTSVGSCSVVHPGVRIGEGCTIEECVVLGKRPRLRAGSRAASLESAGLGALVLGEIREGSVVGPRLVVGRASCVDFGARVGARVAIQTGVYVTAEAVVEDDVFVGPGALMTNDDTLGRHARGDPLRAPVLRRACRVGGGAVLVPGVEIGEEAFVAAGAVVTRDVEARAFVVGIPARMVRRVQDDEILERWR